MSGRQFQVVEDDVGSQFAQQQAQQAQAEQNKVAQQMLMLALKTFSQRAVVAASHLFTLALMAASWVLWSRILPDPSPMQLVGAGMWAVFILAIEYVRRR